jgi:hypothetical protein
MPASPLRFSNKNGDAGVAATAELTDLRSNAMTLTGGGSAAPVPAAASGSPASKMLGRYENGPDKLAFELKPNGVVTMTNDDGSTSNQTWETDGDNRIVISGQEGLKLVYTLNSEGNFSYEHGGVFRKTK